MVSFWASLKRRRSTAAVAVLGGALDQVQAAGVGSRDLAALLQDQVEQLVDVALGRELHADLVQHAELGAPALVRVLELEQRAARVHRLEGALEREPQAHRRHRARDDVVQEGEPLQQPVAVAAGVGRGHQPHAFRGAVLEPGLDRPCSAVSSDRPREHEGCASSVERRLQSREGANLDDAPREFPRAPIADRPR
jgi:hypothetical protein